jgi:hypothetical protein
MSVPEQQKDERCASCGKLGTTRLKTDLHNVPLCDDCADRIRTGNAVAYFVPTEESPPQPEERFEELFGAARALFEAGVVDEDVVYPTLVFANEIWHRLDFAAARDRLVAAWNDTNLWREEADRFTREYRGFKPVRVTERVLFLELQPVFAAVRNYQSTNVPEEVEIRVHPRRNPASIEQVTAAYKKTLSEAGIPCDVEDRVSLDSGFSEGLLWMRVKNGWEVPEEHAPIVWQVRKPRFPHPQLIGALYSALYGKSTKGKDGYARLLETRQRGRVPEMYNLIPACLAFFLRRYGALKQGKVHNLLNKHVLRAYHPQGGMPEKDDGQRYQSRKSQLWDDSKRVGQKLLHVAYLLYYSEE